LILRSRYIKKPVTTNGQPTCDSIATMRLCATVRHEVDWSLEPQADGICKSVFIYKLLLLCRLATLAPFSRTEANHYRVQK